MHEVFAFSAAGEGGTLLLQMHTQKPRAFAGVTGQGNVDPLAPPGPLQMHEVLMIFGGWGVFRAGHPQGSGNPPMPLHIHEVLLFLGDGASARVRQPSKSPCNAEGSLRFWQWASHGS